MVSKGHERIQFYTSYGLQHYAPNGIEARLSLLNALEMRRVSVAGVVKWYSAFLYSSTES